ncbi:MAG: hypothetical protein Q9160_004913 [Pyrenula sp. 1 TL-2023]
MEHFTLDASGISDVAAQHTSYPSSITAHYETEHSSSYSGRTQRLQSCKYIAHKLLAGPNNAWKDNPAILAMLDAISRPASAPPKLLQPEAQASLRGDDGINPSIVSIDITAWLRESERRRNRTLAVYRHATLCTAARRRVPSQEDVFGWSPNYVRLDPMSDTSPEHAASSRSPSTSSSSAGSSSFTDDDDASSSMGNLEDTFPRTTMQSSEQANQFTKSPKPAFKRLRTHQFEYSHESSITGAQANIPSWLQRSPLLSPITKKLDKYYPIVDLTRLEYEERLLDAEKGLSGAVKQTYVPLPYSPSRRQRTFAAPCAQAAIKIPSNLLPPTPPQTPKEKDNEPVSDYPIIDPMRLEHEVKLLETRKSLQDADKRLADTKERPYFPVPQSPSERLRSSSAPILPSVARARANQYSSTDEWFDDDDNESFYERSDRCEKGEGRTDTRTLNDHRGPVKFMMFDAADPSGKAQPLNISGALPPKSVQHQTAAEVGPESKASFEPFPPFANAKYEDGDEESDCPAELPNGVALFDGTEECPQLSSQQEQQSCAHRYCYRGEAQKGDGGNETNHDRRNYSQQLEAGLNPVRPPIDYQGTWSSNIRTAWERYREDKRSNGSDADDSSARFSGNNDHSGTSEDEEEYRGRSRNRRHYYTGLASVESSPEDGESPTPPYVPRSARRIPEENNLPSQGASMSVILERAVPAVRVYGVSAERAAGLRGGGGVTSSEEEMPQELDPDEQQSPPLDPTPSGDNGGPSVDLTLTAPAPTTTTAVTATGDETGNGGERKRKRPSDDEGDIREPDESRNVLMPPPPLPPRLSLRPPRLGGPPLLPPSSTPLPSHPPPNVPTPDVSPLRLPPAAGESSPAQSSPPSPSPQLRPATPGSPSLENEWIELQELDRPRPDALGHGHDSATLDQSQSNDSSGQHQSLDEAQSKSPEEESTPPAVDGTGETHADVDVDVNVSTADAERETGLLSGPEQLFLDPVVLTTKGGDENRRWYWSSLWAFVGRLYQLFRIQTWCWLVFTLLRFSYNRLSYIFRLFSRQMLWRIGLWDFWTRMLGTRRRRERARRHQAKRNRARRNRESDTVAETDTETDTETDIETDKETELGEQPPSSEDEDEDSGDDRRPSLRGGAGEPRRSRLRWNPSRRTAQDIPLEEINLVDNGDGSDNPSEPFPMLLSEDADSNDYAQPILCGLLKILIWLFSLAETVSCLLKLFGGERLGANTGEEEEGQSRWANWAPPRPRCPSWLRERSLPRHERSFWRRERLAKLREGCVLSPVWAIIWCWRRFNDLRARLKNVGGRIRGWFRRLRGDEHATSAAAAAEEGQRPREELPDVGPEDLASMLRQGSRENIELAALGPPREDPRGGSAENLPEDQNGAADAETEAEGSIHANVRPASPPPGPLDQAAFNLEHHPRDFATEPARPLGDPLPEWLDGPRPRETNGEAGPSNDNDNEGRSLSGGNPACNRPSVAAWIKAQSDEDEEQLRIEAERKNPRTPVRERLRVRWYRSVHRIWENMKETVGSG